MNKEKQVMEDSMVLQNTQKWTVPSYSNNNEVDLAEKVGDIEKHGIQRLQSEAFTYSYVMADLDFNLDRIYTNYSGDVSGRFVEVLSMASKGDINYHRFLRKVMEAIPELQKRDGHFGVEIDWAQSIDKPEFPHLAKMMPIFWGSSRMLPGLIESWLTFGDPSSLDAAKKLGDFYVNTGDRFCDSARFGEYMEAGTSGAAYVTCYFPGMEGLAGLYEITQEKKYLDQAERMAAFRHEFGFDKLPNVHSHGYLCSEYSLLLLYAQTGKEVYLTEAQAGWEHLVENGYVSPGGGVLEYSRIGCGTDEGCALADWLRHNLELWRQTGKRRYLDMAGRCLNNQFAVNQCKTGGFGQRLVHSDPKGQIGYGKFYDEALWCCDFHGTLVTQLLKRYLTTGGNETLHIHLPIDFSSPVNVGLMEIVLNQQSIPTHEAGVLLKQRIDLVAKNGNQGGVYVAIHFPDWADGMLLTDSDGKTIPLVRDENEMRTEWKVVLGQSIYVAYTGGLVVENRRFARKDLTKADHLTEDVVLRYGPDVMTLRDWQEVPVLIVTKSSDGMSINLPEDFRFPVLKRAEIEGKSAEDLIQRANVFQLAPQGAMSDETESVFVFDLMFTADHN